MVKVLTVGNNPSGIKQIENQLSLLKDEFPDLYLGSAKAGAISSAIGDNINILIYDAGELKPLMGVLVNELRKTGFLGPIVIVAKVPPGMKLNDFRKVKNLHIVEKPYMKMQLLGIVRNCIRDASMGIRKYKRFDVKESAVLETYNSDFKIETTINNISQNGVCIEGNLTGLKQGDLLRLHFNFKEINKERVMSARVVWLKKDADNKEEAGLEFVSQQTVYKYLLTHAVS